MRPFLFAATILLLASSASAQPQFSWATRDANTTYNINPAFPRQVVAAHNGKALWGVIQNNSISFGQAMMGDYKLMELDGAGNILATSLMTGTFSLINAQADASGNWYILGTYYDSVRCANGMSLVRNSNGPESAYFMVRLHTGTLAADWIKTVGGNDYCGTECFTVTPAGIYLPVDSALGSSINRLDLNTGARTKLWQQTGLSHIGNISADAEGNVYIMGTCVGASGISFNGTQSAPPATLGYPWYVARYKANGQHHWHYWLNGISCFERSFKLVGPNTVYLTGALADSATLGGHHFSRPVGFSNTDYLMSRLDSNGNIVWAQQRPITTVTQGAVFFNSAHHAAIVDTSLYMFCESQGYCIWGPGGITTSTNNKRQGTLVSFGTASGSTKWAKTIVSNFSSAQHIVSDGSGLWITGVASDSAALQFDTVSLVVSSSQYVPYLAKMTVGTATTSIMDVGKDDQLIVWPNPARDALNIRSEVKASAHLIDLSGRVLQTVYLSGSSTVEKLPTNGLPRGIYLLEIRSDEGATVQRVVLE